ncbi:zinc-binding dehydrogenase [Paenibacillus sp. FSL H7-0331]|uniref:zinc-binding dehydrogenase n=1 Tax=Paenibacillus sp. FSL H7-0331 TaxID=1920421 RepID=UPI0009F947B2
MFSALPLFVYPVDSGGLNVTIDCIFPLKETATAHRKSESRRVRGKIVISVILA